MKRDWGPSYLVDTHALLSQFFYICYRARPACFHWAPSVKERVERCISPGILEIDFFTQAIWTYDFERNKITEANKLLSFQSPQFPAFLKPSLPPTQTYTAKQVSLGTGKLRKRSWCSVTVEPRVNVVLCCSQTHLIRNNAWKGEHRCCQECVRLPLRFSELITIKSMSTEQNQAEFSLPENIGFAMAISKPPDGP